jgi:putative IMPACT (imprinted ancient) family translation regulator
VLKKNNLTDICCVVTRYFGGVLLGGGGLVRAYSHAVKIVVDSAQILNMNECKKITISTDYNMYGKINYCLPDFHIKMINSEFEENVKMEMFVKTELYNSLIDKITDVTNGKADIITDETILFEDFAEL